jgi:RHS repeat-associated protein
MIRNSFAAGLLSETRHYFYTAAWQSIEERVGASTSAERQFVWGLRFIDDLILRDRDTTGGGTLNERLYALQDPLGSIAGVVTSAGGIQERYAYAPYGTPFFQSPVFTTRTESFFEWETLFAAYRFDSAASLYAVRHRLFCFPIGAWITRDPFGFDGSPLNLYVYVEGRPTESRDPMGLARSAADALKECNALLANALKDASVARVATIARAIRCKVHIYCSNGCGPAAPGGITFNDGTYVHICIDADQIYTIEQVISILLHETVHAQQQRLCCPTSYVGPPPKAPPLARIPCSTCIRLETPAYTANCNYEYSDPADRKQCIAAGLWASCNHVCGTRIPNVPPPIAGDYSVPGEFGP